LEKLDMDKLLTRLTIASVLAATASLSYAQDVTFSGYYISAKVAAAQLKADNMETSLRPGIGQFVAGDDQKDLTNASLGLGYDFGNGWRTEGEYTFKNDAEFTSGSSNFPTSFNHHKIETQRLMLNAYRDFEIMQNIAVYGNIGLGVARTEASGWQGNRTRQYLSNTDTQLVYSLGAGATYQAIKNLNLDLGYRYVDLGKADSGLNHFANARSLQDEQMKAHLYSSEFYLGARYSF
jgi:opacity protein-like surface antigen